MLYLQLGVFVDPFDLLCLGADLRTWPQGNCSNHAVTTPHVEAGHQGSQRSRKVSVQRIEESPTKPSAKRLKSTTSFTLKVASNQALKKWIVQ